VNSCAYAAINEDGSLETWNDATPLPDIRSSHSAVAYNGFVYIIGGVNASSEFPTDVLVAPLNSNGSVGTWSPTSPIPSGRGNSTLVAHNGFLYLIGGLSADTSFADVLVAAVRADGTVGTWTPSTSLPSPRSAHASVVHNGYVYVIGGSPDSGFSFVSDVLYAPLNGDGTVGDWTDTGSIDSERAYHSAFLNGGFVHITGGFDAAFGFLTDHLVAALNPDGSVGPWSAAAELPSGRVWHTAVAYRGTAYVIGGFNPTFTVVPDVLRAPLDPDIANQNQLPARLRGAYSVLVDLGGDSDTRYVTLNGTLSPGGQVRLQIRIAPEDTADFGPDQVVDPAPLGAALEIPGNGRYVWIRFILDDTGTTNAALPTQVSEILVSEMAPPSAGVVHDGPGSDIDAQTSTTRIEANWSGFTPSPGDAIDHYEWAIGTAPGLTDLQNWVNVGSSTTAANTSLSLSPGLVFVSVRATGDSGLTSLPSTSDGVDVVLAPTIIGGGGDDDDDKRCALGTAGAPGLLLPMLLGAAFLATRRRR
jgi:hypothetical protein